MFSLAVTVSNVKRPSVPSSPFSDDDFSRRDKPQSSDLFVPASQQSRDPRVPIRASKPAVDVPTGKKFLRELEGALQSSSFDEADLGRTDAMRQDPVHAPVSGFMSQSGEFFEGKSDEAAQDGEILTSVPRGGRKKKSKRTRRIVLWSAATLTLVILGAGFYAGSMYFRFVGGVSRIDAFGGAQTAKNINEPLNILLVGDDYRPAGATQEELDRLSTTDSGGGLNTDAIMILHLPAGGKSATLISVPRDSWVDVPGHGMNKINAAFHLGDGIEDPAAGAQMLIQTIEQLTGMQMNHFMRISLLGFYTLAEALGPIEVCLKEAVDDPYSGLKLPAGVSTLDAKQSLSFVRQRHGLPRGDIDRGVRQQYFLTLQIQRFLSTEILLNPQKLTEALDAVSGAIETDPGFDFFQMALRMRELRPSNINSATIPIIGTDLIYSGGYEISIVEVDHEAMPAFVESITSGPSPLEKAEPAKPGDTQVRALNAGGAEGSSAEATDFLRGHGFKVGEVGDAEPQEASVIYYPPGKESEAKAVSIFFPQLPVVENSTVNMVTVLLGADGYRPEEPPAPEEVQQVSVVPTPGQTTQFDNRVCVY